MMCRTDSRSKYVDFPHFAPSLIFRCVRKLAPLKQAPTSELYSQNGKKSPIICLRPSVAHIICKNIVCVVQFYKRDSEPELCGKII